MHSVSSRLLALTFALLGVACSDRPGNSGVAEATDVKSALKRQLGDEPLERGQPSLEALATRVVEGLNARDEQALSRLVITEAEYKTRLFGVLARHKTAHQMGADLLWSMQHRESADDLGHILDLHGGRGYELVAVEPERVDARDGVTLHRKPVLVVREAGDAEPRRLRLLATVVEHDKTHTFKLIAYRLRGDDS